MNAEQRLAAAGAFWKEDQSDIEMQHAEAILTIARRLNFRVKSVQALPIEKRTRLLAQLGDVSDAVATRALISYHFNTKRELMAAFLDALGITHDNGLINEETVAAPDRAKLEAGIKQLRASFSQSDVDLYLRTLSVLDGDTWAELESAMAAQA